MIKYKFTGRNFLSYMLFLLLKISTLLFVTTTQAQIYTKKTVPSIYISKSYHPVYNVSGDSFYKMPTQAANIKDHTAILQKTLDQYKNVVLPDQTLYINKLGIKIPSDRKVVFQKNTRIDFLGGASGKFSDVIKIYDAKNIIVFNPVIYGSKYKNMIQQGQWNAGICILNSSDILIVQPKIVSSFGDGIMIGSEDGGFSSNVKIAGGWVDDARRNGLSVTSGNNIIIENLLISNTNGHDPESGIDIEPSWNKDILDNIKLKNIITFNNKNAGISINLNGLSVNEKKNRKTSTVIIDGHLDSHSKHGLLTSLNGIPGLFDTAGSISVKNAEWEQSREASYWKSNTKQIIKIFFENIKVKERIKKNEFEKTVKNADNIIMFAP